MDKYKYGGVISVIFAPLIMGYIVDVWDINTTAFQSFWDSSDVTVQIYCYFIF